MNKASTVLLGLGVLAAAAACAADVAFSCNEDSECVDGPHRGTCQPNHACSFADSECASGQRYAPASGQGLAGMCVEPDSSGTSAASTATGESDATSEAGTTASDAGETSPSTSGATRGSTSGSDSTGGPRCSVFTDEFDGKALGAAWGTIHDDDNNIELTVADGQLRYTLHPVVEPGYAHAQLLAPQVIAGGGSAMIEVAAASLSPGENLFLALGSVDADVRIDLMIAGPSLRARRVVGGDIEEFAEIPYDPRAHRFLRMREADGVLEFETSADGAMFMSFAAADIGPFDEFALEVISTTYEPPVVEDVVILVDAFSVTSCPAR